MATALPADDISDVCSNCVLFNWKQPENPKTVRRCTRCHVVAYCGKECQEEHWHKVHRKQCKYLGGLKKAKDSEHKKETCKTCIESESVGDLVFSPTNPYYVCIFEHVDWKLLPPNYPHPFPLTGSPEDRIERILSVAQKILLKIKMTKNPVYLKEQQAVDQLEAELWDMRGKMHMHRITGEDKDPTTIPVQIAKAFLKSRRPWIALGCSFDSRKWQDGYKLWATYALLTELMHSTNTLSLENTLKFPDSLPNDYRQMSKKEEFLEVADKIIEALDQKVVPFSDLARIACGGKTEQNCSQCGKEIVVKGIYSFKERTSTADIVFNAVETERYICESSECHDKEKDRTTDTMVAWMAAVMATHRRLQETRCDRCFLMAPLKEVHRSKCRTKNYCSQVCRDADDSVHKVCCNPDKGQRRIEERKVKIGGKDKVVAANAGTDSMAQRMRKNTLSQPALGKRFVEIIEKTKKVKGTVKRAEKKIAKIDEVD